MLIMVIDNAILNNFTKNFSATDYADIIIRTQRLVDALCTANKLKPITVAWKDFEDLSIKASSDNAGNMFLNLTYIRAVVELNLNSYATNFVSKLKIAAKSYFKNNLRHNVVTDALIYTINNRPIECLLSLGSADDLKYILLINVLMHVQHYIQLKSTQFVYKFMRMQDALNPQVSLSHIDANAEVMPIIHKLFNSLAFLDKETKANLINSYIIVYPNPELTAEKIIVDFMQHNQLSAKQQKEIKDFAVARIKIINKIDNFYFPKRTKSEN